jgi:hypothetical protein
LEKILLEISTTLLDIFPLRNYSPRKNRRFMINAEAEILKHRKAEELSKAFTRRLFQEGEEISVKMEKVLQEVLKDNLFVLCTEFRENIIDPYQDKNFLKSYSNRQLSKQFSDFAYLDKGTFVRSEYDISENTNVYKARKYSMLIKV